MALAAALIVPAGASGASLGFNFTSTWHATEGLFFSEGAGATNDALPEANTVALTWSDRNDRRLGFTDRNPIVPRADDYLADTVQRCTFLVMEARCKEPTDFPRGPGIVEFRLGEKNDSLRVAAAVRVLTLAHGGPGSDRLLGASYGFGGEGGDVIVGDHGESVLGVYWGSLSQPDPEDPPIQGDPGDDHFHAQDGHVDKVYCGPGYDTVHDADPGDYLNGCEVVPG